MNGVPPAAALPRVLVVTSNNFNLTGGGGITLTNLFRGWPADRLANVHEDPTPPDRSVCSNFYRLTRREVCWIRPLSMFEPSASSAGAQTEGTSALATEGAAWRRALVGDGVPRDAVISAGLEQWLSDFRPQLVYGFLGSLAQIRLLRRVAARWRAPMAVHIMDDWPAVIYTRGLLAPVFRSIVMRELNETLDQAAARMAISSEMAADYSRRFGHPFVAFHNALDMTEWMPVARRSWTVRQPATVRYVGSIYGEAQREAMRDICDAVTALRRSGVAVSLSICAPASHTQPIRDWRYASDAVRIEEAPPSAEVPRLLVDADVLVLPFNFDDASARYMRLSMPTKIPAYMASGTPVLVYGPASLAAVAYADRECWGLAVTEQGSAAVQQALGRLLQDLRLREDLGRRAEALAREHHDIRTVRQGFWSTLVEASERAGEP